MPDHWTRHKRLSPQQRLRQGCSAALLVGLATLVLVPLQAWAQGDAGANAVLGRPRQIRAPQIESEPVIDGRLDEQAWSRAERTGPFLVPGKRMLAGQQTEARFCRGGGALFIGVRCFDSDTLNLRAECATRDGGGIFNDDCVEIFLAPPGQVVYCHFAVNSKGVLYDSKGARLAGTAVPQSRRTFRRTPGRWRCGSRWPTWDR